MKLTPTSLRFIRTLIGVEQTQLAESAGISTSLLSSIERGERNITPVVERKLRAAIGIDEDVLDKLVELQHEIRLQRAACN